MSLRDEQADTAVHFRRSGAGRLSVSGLNTQLLHTSAGADTETFADHIRFAPKSIHG